MNTLHAVVIDASLDDGETLIWALRSVGIEHVDYFSNAEAAHAAFLTDRVMFSRSIVFIRDEPRALTNAFIQNVMTDVDLSDLHIVLTSSKTDASDLLWAFRLGALAHLNLPIDLNKLNAVVNASKIRRYRAG